MKKIAVFTSGGDAPGMNACVRAVVRTTLRRGYEAVGIFRGYQGMIEGDFWAMEAHSVSNIIQLGGTILRSARSQDFRTPEGRAKAYANLRANDIDGIVAIGGDGSFTGARIFMEEYPDIHMVGCPGTIDNDLYGTDYTIGYDTAINTAMNAIDNIKDTANAHDRLFFVEVMGRDAGFIAMNVGIATGAEAVLVPESKTDVQTLIDTLNSNYSNKKNSSIVVVAEGDESGGAFKLAEEVKKHCPYETKVTILGHLQRGGRPTCMDRVRSSRMGVAAVNALLEGKSGVMIGEINGEIVHTPFEQAIKYHNEINPMLLEMVDILS
ncbi:6-phosphofructokinase [Phaeodactylibacter xiamenensis]|uniref:6-phosphofructokinase n=1 Tax=Phaeodactylibacter xiamenensis TaxID=1524460 RepID=UPI0024A86DAC|nr:6-phosphofructokinase [Phaeodactylibacter xiamenensis]